MRHGIFLGGLLGIDLNLRRLVVSLEIHALILVHFMVDLIMPLLCVTCVILMIIKLIHVLIMHDVLNL